VTEGIIPVSLLCVCEDYRTGTSLSYFQSFVDT
jgi:hypothetical protein